MILRLAGPFVRRALARQRRVKGVTSTRLPDPSPKRVRVRCHFLWQFRPAGRAREMSATTKNLRLVKSGVNPCKSMASIPKGAGAPTIEYYSRAPDLNCETAQSLPLNGPDFDSLLRLAGSFLHMPKPPLPQHRKVLLSMAQHFAHDQPKFCIP
jgi:hypothetical protein